MRPQYIADVRQEYARIAAAHTRSQEDRQRLSLSAARANQPKLDWSGTYVPTRPQFVGTRVFTDYPLEELVKFIDWSPFFATWDLKGKFPSILNDDRFGKAAYSLYNDALAMLDNIIAENWLQAAAVVGLWPANSEGDDIAVFADESRVQRLTVLHTLRQQLVRREGRANTALADFVAPGDSGIADYIGGFAVTAGIGEQELSNRFKLANDDYSAIMVKALADRLAEAFAEHLHARVRREFWGYAADEALSLEELLSEQYRGIRPAPGYPAQPDHTEKGTLFKLLSAEQQVGMRLTESFAMWPSASVCGLYFSHPDSHYFGIGKIEHDQVEDYARRKGWKTETAEKWLAPILNYDPVPPRMQPLP
jgi:5-methyltetrahydrofolate--homocysteine methyltransferase